MKIGFSTSVIQGGKTGIAQYVFAFLRAARRLAEHEFVLFVLEDDLPLFAFLEDDMQIEVVPERFRPPLRNIGWHQFHLPQRARELKLDVLHVPSYRRMLWPQPCPLVATIHDLAPFRVARKYDWKRMFYGRVVARRLAQRQTHLIAVSQATARDIETFFGIPSERVSVVHNGLDHERFANRSRERARAAVVARFNLRRPYFLYVARLEHPGKNHVRLIEAFNEFKQVTGSAWQLAFAGSDWHGAPAIHNAIRASRFAQDIHCLGFVPDAALPDLYTAAEVFVYPSLHEGFGFPPLEAMACGCPVIGSTRGSLAEVLGGAAIEINPENTAEMAESLRRMTQDEALRERLRSAGFERARTFDWQNTVAETFAVYSRVAVQPKKICVPA